MMHIDQTQAKAALQTAIPPPVFTENLEETIIAMNTMLYNIANDSQIEDSHANQEQVIMSASSNTRWKQLIEDRDSREIWKAINWNGLTNASSGEDKPSDEAFREHFEKL